MFDFGPALKAGLMLFVLVQPRYRTSAPLSNAVRFGTIENDRPDSVIVGNIWFAEIICTA